MVDRFRKSMLRVRVFHKDVLLEQIERDNYYEFGTFVDSDFIITRNEKEGKSAILELECLGNVKDPNSEEKIPYKIMKQITVEDNKITILLRGSLIKITGKKHTYKKIFDQLYFGVDFPFFFNGDPNKFSWESNQIVYDKKSNLLATFEYVGRHFKAIDGSYDFHFECEIINNSKSDLETMTIGRFPIIAYAYTDEGYQKIYQGINLIPRFQMAENFEYKIKLKLY